MAARKKTTGDASKPSPAIVPPRTMLRATQRSNPNQALGYYYGGSLGDSVERRFSGFGFDGGLGGGADAWHGSGGAQSSYPAIGASFFYGTGLGFGPQNRYGPWGMATGAGGFQYLKRFSGNAQFNHSVIASCMMAYLGYGVVRNVIDLYTSFACEGLQIFHTDKSVERFYRTWAKKVKLNERIDRIFGDMFISGNVFVHRRWAKLSDAEKRTMKSATAETKVIGDTLVVQPEKGRYKEIRAAEEAVADFLDSHKTSPTEKARAASPIKNPVKEENQKNKKKLIPWEYTSLNPLQMELRGSKFKNENYWVMALDRRDSKDLFSSFGGNYQELGETEQNLPPEFKGRISRYEGSGRGYVSEIKLTDDEMTVLHDRKFDYWDWAVPFTYPALRSISFKDCLRNMEAQACESVINSIFLFKLGDQDKGMPAEEEHFERLADMLQIPGQALNVIWNEAIEAEVLQPNVSNIFDPRKHESADRDILVSLGIPEVLIGGKGGNFSNSFIALAGILEKIESVRERVQEWLDGELKTVADAMGFRRLPVVRFGKTSLRDKNAERTFMMNLMDRGILSAETVLNELGTTVEIEQTRQQAEKDIAESTGVGVFDKRGPYYKPEDMVKNAMIIPPGWDEEHKITEQMEAKEEQQAQQAEENKKIDQERFDQNMQLQEKKLDLQMQGPKTGNGRPPGAKDGQSRGPQENKRPPKGQNVAMLDQYDILHARGREMLDSLEKRLSARFLRSKGFRYVKQMPHEERERLENLVYNVFSHMPARPEDHFESDDFLVNLLKNQEVTEEMKADVLANYHRKLATHREVFKKDANREHRRQFMVSAWTQLAITNMYESPQNLVYSKDDGNPSEDS